MQTILFLSLSLSLLCSVLFSPIFIETTTAYRFQILYYFLNENVTSIWKKKRRGKKINRIYRQTSMYNLQNWWTVVSTEHDVRILSFSAKMTDSPVPTTHEACHKNHTRTPQTNPSWKSYPLISSYIQIS